MATLITGTTQQVSLTNSNPVESLPFGELAEFYQFDPTMKFPLRPPSWVMAQAALATLVTDGVVTVE